MESAQSIRKGQFSIKCQLCEIETKIQWKCVDCKLLMCDKCKEKIHPKFKKASQHNILTTKEIGLESGVSKDTGRDFSEIECKEHKGQMCVIFCKACDQLACPVCIAKTHQKHDLIVIEEAFQIKLNNLDDTQAHIENQKKEIEKDLEVLDKMKVTESTRAKKTKEDISQQKQCLHKTVDQYARNLEGQVDDRWKFTEQSIDQEKNRILQFNNQLKEKASKIDVIKLQDTGIFMDETSNLEKFKLDLPSVKFPKSVRQDFVPGEITQNNFGLLQKMRDSKANDANCPLTALNEFTTKLKSVGNIIPIANDTIWMHGCIGRKGDNLMKVKIEKNALKVLESYKEDGCYNITLTLQNDLIISIENNKPKILPAGKSCISTFDYDIEPFFARAIHITQANNIIFGACKTKYDFDENGGGVVIVKDMQGHEKAVYEYDNNGKALFTVPCRITSTKQEILVVVDIISEDYSGRIVILENSNSHIYHGHPDINSKNHQFKPQAVQTTKGDNIIVSDLHNNTLHILDSHGNLLAYHNTMEAGIMGPLSLGFIKPGHMFIGCSSPSISSDNAKMYEVKMLEY